MNPNAVAVSSREPWNKGKLVGQKAPLKLKDLWAIRVRLQLSNDIRSLALLNLAIVLSVAARIQYSYVQHH